MDDKAREVIQKLLAVNKQPIAVNVYRIAEAAMPACQGYALDRLADIAAEEVIASLGAVAWERDALQDLSRRQK